MGLFSRLVDLLEANISDLISKAEDPEKMLNLYIEKATEQIKDFNVQVNRSVADQLQLKQKVEACKKEIDSWGSQAKAAVIQGRDDLAKVALQRKQTAQNNLVSYEAQLVEQEKTVAQLQENYRLLQEKLDNARRERDDLVMRQRRAEAMKKASEAVSDISSNDALNNFGRIKDKVSRMEAEAQAANLSLHTVEDEFTKLQKCANEVAVDDELAKLKAELGK